MATLERRTALPPFERFMAYRRFSAGLAFTHDGSDVLFVSNISGQFNLWRSGGGWPEQLTAFTDITVRLLGVSPRDGTIVICADRDGDEFHQLYFVDPEQGWPEQITDAPRVQHFVGPDAFSPDGTKLAYAANARIETDNETWIHNLDSGEARNVFGEGKNTYPAAWSPDGTKILVLDFRAISDTSIYLVDLDAGESRELTPHDEEGVYLPGPWTADGSGFYFITDEGREFRGLAFYDVASGTHEWVETHEADVEEVTASRDGRVLAWLVNEDGWDVLRLRELDSGRDLPPADMPPGARPAITGFRAPIAL